ncbi:putative bromodomain protein, partial [Trifolium medium]|nr:putative bromodomain protein [Trifolium medium]
DARVYVRKYKPAMEDVKWAQNKVVATVINGEAIPIVHNRIADVGFTELTIIPTGAG